MVCADAEAGPSVAMILVLRTLKYRSSLGVEGGT